LDFSWQIIETISIGGAGKLPVHSVKLVVPRQSWDQFFSQLKGFARSNNFGVRIARIHPTKEQYTIDMWRKDVAASGENVFAPEEFQIGFYVDPSKGGTPDAVARIVEDMKKYLSKVAGITITQTK
jgi:hypothetical protein